MADESYSIVFSGQVMPGHAEATVRDAMAKQFKLPPEQVERLFSGRRAILKKGLDAAGAAKFESALNRIGAAVTVVIGDDTTDAPGPPAPASSPAPSAAPPPMAPDLGGPAAGPAPPPPPPPDGAHELHVDDPGDPYRPPSAALLDEPMGSDEVHPPRNVGAGRGASWITEGWGYFKHTPGVWIGIFVVFAVIFMASNAIPFLNIILSLALTVVSPVFFGGIMVGADKQRRGDAVDVSDLFSAFNTHLGPLSAVGGIYLGGWIVLSAVIFGVGFALMGSMAGLGANEETMVVGGIIFGLVVIALGTPLLMLIWFAPALIVLHDMPVGEALKASFMGCLKNVLPFVVYGFIAFVLMLLTLPTFFLGWLVLGPVLLLSIYTSYRDVFID